MVGRSKGRHQREGTVGGGRERGWKTSERRTVGGGREGLREDGWTQ